MRKIIQITYSESSDHDLNTSQHLYALCDAGTLWRCNAEYGASDMRWFKCCIKKILEPPMVDEEDKEEYDRLCEYDECSKKIKKLDSLYIRDGKTFCSPECYKEYLEII